MFGVKLHLALRHLLPVGMRLCHTEAWTGSKQVNILVDDEKGIVWGGIIDGTEGGSLKDPAAAVTQAEEYSNGYANCPMLVVKFPPDLQKPPTFLPTSYDSRVHTYHCPPQEMHKVRSLSLLGGRFKDSFGGKVGAFFPHRLLKSTWDASWGLFFVFWGMEGGELFIGRGGRCSPFRVSSYVTAFYFICFVLLFFVFVLYL